MGTSAMISASLAKRLEAERRDGIHTDFFYVKFGERALATRMWMHTQLQGLAKSGYSLGAYGAAAKGMVLLHFLLRVPDRSWELQFVLDDAPLKQGRFCPGTTIPVRNTTSLRGKGAEGRPLAMVIFAWNFWEEIANKIVRTLAGVVSHVICILPFPHPRLLRLDVQPNATQADPYALKHMLWGPPAWPNPLSKPRRPVMLITHFYNEEFMLPYWIQHHAPMFDHVVLINYNTTDKSVDIIRQTAPAGWKVVSAANPNSFGAIAVDADVMKVEREHPNYWHIALTCTEFLVHPDFRASMARIDPKTGERAVIRFRGLWMVGDEDSPLTPFGSLPMQRSVFTDNYVGGNCWGHLSCPINRFMHTGLNQSPYTGQPGTYHYGGGRHGLYTKEVIKYVDTGVIMKYLWTPWPEQKKRKMQVGARVPQSDRAAGMGGHHIANMDAARIELERNRDLKIPRRDLKTINVPPTHSASLVVKIFHQAFDPIQPKF